TELGIELSKKGHEVHFITYSQPVRLDALSSNLHYHEVNVPDYPLFKYLPYELALSSKLFDVISKHEIDVLHVHYAIPHAYAAYMAKKILNENGYKIPIVTTLHGTDITLVGNHPFYKPAVTFSINKSDIVTCVSKSLMEDTREFFGIKREIKVIPNFIDIDKYDKKHNLCERNMIADGDEKIIIHVSNFRPLKRILDVLKIFQKINEKINSKLIMVGDGPDKKKAEEFLRKHNLKNSVIFLGKTNQVDEILCSSDLFLLPSEKESFGLAALEAMALKVPVISTNTGGLKDLNINGNSGYTSDVGDINSMAENAIKILSDNSLEKKYRSQAFENAKKYDIKKVIPLYEKIYNEALNIY
ncbi:MAG: N-acetyl-alpha-D-glucosaminyl L-malate synthase BshA, partial [Cryomorphaceae bacterium]|nr:N-acetyl-alpha-D-glucosaminyl L-malate synthase BshA [Cryomorphaceae bacterium]